MDADFLKAHVGDALTKGMSEVNLYQPADPVEFLGQYLLKYVQNAEQDERVSVLLVGNGERHGAEGAYRFHTGGVR
jgi:hypothetical protein